jgi:hypothetical protein
MQVIDGVELNHGASVKPRDVVVLARDDGQVQVRACGHHSVIITSLVIWGEGEMCCLLQALLLGGSSRFPSQ